MRIINLPIGVALALSTVAAASAAQEAVVTTTPAPRASVSLAGLNLKSSAGIVTAKARVESAAADLCLTNAVEPVDLRMARAQCYRAAVSDGYRQLDRMADTRAAEATSGGASLIIAAK